MGRDRHQGRIPGHVAGFNPRARVGRDRRKTFVYLAGLLFQSTRPRGARLFINSGDVAEIEVSIHAPAWGATGSSTVASVPCAVFQSTRPRGARHDTFNRILVGDDVSIHAPAWGATVTGLFLYLNNRGFNPRARVGRDETCASMASSCVSFNPRARVGRD